jgi:RHS repeat-associated protein
MPNGLGRYGVEDDMGSYVALGENDDPNAMFEWYLKNYLGSTMLVYGTQSVSQSGMADFGIEKAAYDYRAFGEQMSIVEPADKVTENFTGKELDDEIALNYFGARYLDPMLGLWTSVDAKRQYQNLYLYAGDNPIMRVDLDGNQDLQSEVLGMFSVIWKSK